MGVQGNSMDEPRDVRQVVAGDVCHQLQDAAAGCSRTARLSPRRLGRPSALHDLATAESSVEDAVLSGRSSLGTEAAEWPLVVSDRERLGRRMDQTEDSMTFEVLHRALVRFGFLAG